MFTPELGPLAWTDTLYFSSNMILMFKRLNSTPDGTEWLLETRSVLVSTVLRAQVEG